MLTGSEHPQSGHNNVQWVDATESYIGLSVKNPCRYIFCYNMTQFCHSWAATLSSHTVSWSGLRCHTCLCIAASGRSYRTIANWSIEVRLCRLGWSCANTQWCGVAFFWSCHSQQHSSKHRQSCPQWQSHCCTGPEKRHWGKRSRMHSFHVSFALQGIYNQLHSSGSVHWLFMNEYTKEYKQGCINYLHSQQLCGCFV